MRAVFRNGDPVDERHVDHAAAPGFDRRGGVRVGVQAERLGEMVERPGREDRQRQAALVGDLRDRGARCRRRRQRPSASDVVDHRRQRLEVRRPDPSAAIRASGSSAAISSAASLPTGRPVDDHRQSRAPRQRRAHAPAANQRRPVGLHRPQLLDRHAPTSIPTPHRPDVDSCSARRRAPGSTRPPRRAERSAAPATGKLHARRRWRRRRRRRSARWETTTSTGRCRSGGPAWCVPGRAGAGRSAA